MEEKTQFQLRVVTPEGSVLDERATFVKFNATGGEIGILPNHSPLLAKIQPGELEVRSGERTTHYLITSGIAEVMQDEVTILTPYLEHGTDIDLDRAKSAEKRAMKRLNTRPSDTDISRATDALARAKSRIYLYELLEKLGNKP